MVLSSINLHAFRGPHQSVAKPTIDVMDLTNSFDNRGRDREGFANRARDQRGIKASLLFGIDVFDFVDHLAEDVPFGKQRELFRCVGTGLSSGKEYVVHGRLNPSMPIFEIDRSRHCGVTVERRSTLDRAFPWDKTARQPGDGQ